jgi:hypothetical protein
LSAGVVDDEVRRRGAEGRVVAGLVAVLIDGGSQLGQAGEIGVGVGLGGDLVLGIEKVRQVMEGRAAHLVEDVRIAGPAAGVFEFLGRRDLLAQAVEHDIAVELVGWRQGAGVEGLQPRELARGEVLILLHRGEGAVGEFGPLVRPGAEIEADGGRRLRLHVQTLLDEGGEQLVELGVGPRRGEGGEGQGGKGGGGGARPKKFAAIHIGVSPDVTLLGRR